MPTLKQKKVVKELSDNVGMPIGEAMRRSGYSKTTSETPQRLTDSKGWEELMESYLPDKDLAKVHKEGLKATKHQGVGGMVMGLEKGKVDSVGHTEIEIADYATRHKYLDSAYKLKGKYAADKVEHSGSFTLENLFTNAKDKSN